MKEHISVCCVSQSFVPYIGGLSNYVEALGKQFLKNGHEFKVIHFRTPSIGTIEFAEGIEIIRTDIPKLGEETFKKYMHFKELVLNVTHEENGNGNDIEGYDEYKQVNEKFAHDIVDAYNYKPFDILHVHDFQTLPLAKIIKTKANINIPIVFTWHVPFIENIPEWWKKFFIEKMGYYDKVIFSTDEYVKAGISLGLSEQNTLKISPFIDISKYNVTGPNGIRETYGIRKDEIVILCVSRIDPRKGQEILIAAMEIIIKIHNQKNVKCVFVGNGSFSNEMLKKHRSKRLEELKKKVKDMSLGDYIIFTGSVEQQELHQWYETSDMVIQPSLQEGFGLTISEAMAFAKPVIGSNVGGIPDQIEENVNGYMFEKGEYKQLADKMMLLVQSSELRKTFGDNGNKTVKEKFSSETGYAKHLELYQKVLGKSK